MADLTEDWSDVDTDSIAPDSGIPEPFPEGRYRLQATKLERNSTKSNNGIVLNGELIVMEGEYEGRKVFVNFNTRNSNAQAQTIGIAQFKAFCLACDIPFEVAAPNTDVLVYVPFEADVKIRPAGPGKDGRHYDARNEIKKYIPAGGAPAQTAAHAHAHAQKAAPAAAPQKAGGLPWAAKKTA